jgi:ADP-ribosyl-[dinitrogen reductase] hydrolase
VCGQVAGAHYGVAAIPAEWLKKLAMHGEMDALAKKLCNKQVAQSH